MMDTKDIEVQIIGIDNGGVILSVFTPKLDGQYEHMVQVSDELIEIVIDEEVPKKFHSKLKENLYVMISEIKNDILSLL